MKKLKTTLTIFLIFIAYGVSAIDYEWARWYNGGGVDRGLNVITRSNGNSYLAGVSAFPGGSKVVTSTYSFDGVLTSLDVGNTFLSSSNVKKIERDGSRNIYVLCENGPSSFTLIKYNKDAEERWRRNFTNYVVGFEIGNISGVFVSYITPAGMTLKRLHTGDGSTNWTRNINDAELSSNKSLSDFTIDSNDNSYFAGTTGTGPSGDDYRIVKISRNNALLYNRRYTTPGANDEEVYKMEVSNSGNLYIVGDYDNDIPVRTYFHMVKFNSNGNFLWATLFESSGTSSAYLPNDIDIDINGNPVVMGTDNDFYNINPAGEVRRILVSKFNKTTGAIIFSVYPNDPSNTHDDLRETGTCMTIDDNDYIYFGGISNIYAGIAVEPNRWMIAKISGVDGDLQWVDASTANNDPDNQVNDISVTDDDFVYVAASENLGATTDMALIKYCQVDCFSPRLSAPSKSIPLSIYPNPSSQSFTLRTTFLEEQTEMNVFNLEGKLVESRIITNGEFQFGEEYGQGMYIVRLTSPSLSRVIRIVKSE